MQRLQSFAVLIVADSKTHKIEAVSDNFKHFFPINGGELLGGQLREYFPDLKFSQTALDGKAHPFFKFTRATIKIDQVNLFEVSVAYYSDKGSIFIELEPCQVVNNEELLSFNRTLQGYFSLCSNREELISVYLQALQKFNHPDAIYLSKILNNQYMQVVAESHNKTFPTKLNLIQDFPARLRKSFSQCQGRRIEYCPNLNASTTFLVCNNATNDYDLSTSILMPFKRHNSKQHQSTLAKSQLRLFIVVNQCLWGVVELYNQRSRATPMPQRNFLVIATSLLASRIREIELAQESEKRKKILLETQLLASKVRGMKSLASLIKKSKSILTRLIPNDGCMFFINEKVVTPAPSLNPAVACRIYKKHRDNYEGLVELSKAENKRLANGGGNVKCALLIYIDEDKDFFAIIYRLQETSVKTTQENSLDLGEGGGLTAKNLMNTWSSVDLMAIKQIQQIIIEKSLRLALAEKAYKDELTNTFNRHYLKDVYLRKFMACKRIKTSFSMCVIDIDHFKKFNDRYGHALGDRVLKMVAKKLQAHFRIEDVVCRYGGEEFVVVMAGIGKSKALKRCDFVREKINEMTIRHKQKKIDPITVSIGVFSLVATEDPIPFKDSFAKADRALYKAKHNGRNQVVLAAPE